MQRCPYIAEMKERFWRSSNGNEKKSTDDEGTDDLLKSVAMTNKSKKSTIARLAQPEPDDPDETVPMLTPPPTASGVSIAATSGQSSGPPPSVSTVVKVKLFIKILY